MSDLISAANENNRLRIENARLVVEVERLREPLLEFYTEDGERVEGLAIVDGTYLAEMEAEVERMREENAHLSQDLADIRRSAKATFGRWLEAKAAIQRVRDLRAGTTFPGGIPAMDQEFLDGYNAAIDDVRSALDGEQS